MALKHALWVLNDPENRFVGLKGPSMQLLTVLAICASDRGNVCWPSEHWLRKATHQARATIYRSKGPLRDLIEIDPPGYKRSNSYYFPPVNSKGVRITEVAKVLAAKREQELEAKGELRPTLNGEEMSEDKLSAIVDSSLTERQPSQIETDYASNASSKSLNMRRLPSQIETGGGLNLRPKDKDESKKKSRGLLQSQIETSQIETPVDNFDGSRAPTNAAEYEWVKRHCRIAGMDQSHIERFLSQYRPWGWNALKPGVNICDLIADYVTIWKTKSPEEFKYTQEMIKNGVL